MRPSGHLHREEAVDRMGGSGGNSVGRPAAHAVGGLGQLAPLAHMGSNTLDCGG